MLYKYVSIGYTATNVLLASILFLKGSRSSIVRFYVFLVFSLVAFGICGFLAVTNPSPYVGAFVTAVAAFLFALLPFFFLHFMIVMVRREELLHSPVTVAFVYFGGLFSYTFELLGVLPKPVSVGSGLSVMGYLFFVTWMSVFFSIGIALLFTFLRGFSDKGQKSNLLVAGFAILLLLFPGPFTESIFVAFFPNSTGIYFVSSLLSLVIALYFVFRHKIIVNTIYDAMKSAVTCMSDVLFRTDDILNIQLVRGGATALLGYGENEMVGRSLLDLTQQPDLIRTHRDRVMEGKEEQAVIDVDLLSKHGEAVPVNLSLTAVVETGQVVGFVGVGRDMTEKRRSEMLQSALYKLGEITRQTEDLKGFCREIYDVIYHLIPTNDFYIVVRNSIIDELDYPFYVNELYNLPDKHPGIDAFNEQVMLSGNPSTLTVNETKVLGEKEPPTAGRKMPTDWIGVPLKTASGTIGVISIENYSPVSRFGKDEENILSLLSGQIAAAIERKQSDEKIREQAALLNKAQDAIILEALDGTILFWNQAAARIFGWSYEEAIGRKLVDLYKSNVLFPLTYAREAVLKDGDWSGEIVRLNRSGAEVVMDCRWKLLYDAEGKPKSIMQVCTDVTEKKKLEAQFMRAQRLESIGTLAGGIAHDLNNVLSPIMMSVRTLKLKLTDEDSGKILQALESSAKRGADMVRQVLMFGRGAQGDRLVLQPRHIIRETLNIATETFPKSIQIEHSMPKDLWTIMGDATQIHQVLLNLSVNARDAMPDGGVLTITADNVVLNEDYAKLNIDAKRGKYVVITVSDTGRGIPPNLIDKIFEPFFTTKEIGKGTGLGLSTALALVKGHGGFLNVYSELNKGTSFKVFLPACDLVEPGAPVELDMDRYVGEGELILVVDDESSIREIARATLEAFGYKVVVARDGAEAIAVFAKNMSKIQLVIIDNMMPVLDGKSAIPALRRMETSAKIVATSGFQQESTGIVPEQIDGFLGKPFTGEMLLKTVHEVLHEQN